MTEPASWQSWSPDQATAYAASCGIEVSKFLDVLQQAQAGDDDAKRRLAGIIAGEPTSSSGFEAEAVEACPVCGSMVCEDPSHEAPEAEHRPCEAPRRLKAFTLPELHAHRFPHRRAVLRRGNVTVLREGQVWQVHADRGVGKSQFVSALALVAAVPGLEVLGFHSLESSRVLVIDGEMPGEELQSRSVNLCELLHVDPPPNVVMLGADWQEHFFPRLDSIEGQEAVEPFVEAADLIVIDNRSCLFDPEGEKDPKSWQPAQTWLLSLRRRGKAVVIVHHSNRAGGSRGHSKAEDMMDVILKLSRPSGYSQDQGARFLVEWTKTRGIHGESVVPFIASLGPEGWVLETAERVESDDAATRLLEYLAVADAAGERPKSGSAAVRGAGLNKRTGLRSWGELLRTRQILQHPSGGFVRA